MRIPIIIGIGLAAMGIAAYVASKRLVIEQKPPTPAPAFVLEASKPGAPPSRVEHDLAIPIEEALAKVPAVKRIRSRSQAGKVTVEVWCPETTEFAGVLPAGVTVRRADAKLETYWVLRGDERPTVDGVLCGREAPLTNVHIDPEKLQALQISALMVDRALKAAAPIDELLKTEVAEKVRLADVATVDVAPPPTKCTARTPEGPAWFVRTFQQELGGTAERVDKPTRVELKLRGNLPEKLTSLQPKVVTVEPVGNVTLWFSPALTAPERAKVLAELRAIPEVSVRHVSGLPRVRLVLTGADRSDLRGLAGTIIDTLKFAKGVVLVVPPPEAEPFLDLKVDEERAKLAGVPVVDVFELSELVLRGREHDGLRVSVELAQREHIAALFVAGRRLSELVTLTEKPELPELVRDDRQAALEILAYGIGREGVPMPALPGGVMLEIHEEL